MDPDIDIKFPQVVMEIVRYDRGIPLSIQSICGSTHVELTTKIKHTCFERSL